MYSFFSSCGVKTTHSAIFSTFLFICHWHPELLISASRVQVIPTFSFFYDFKYILMCSPTGSIKLAQKDGQATSLNMMLLFCHIFLWSGQKTSRHSFCVSLQLETPITERVSKSLSVCLWLFVAYLFFIQFYCFVSIFFLSFSVLVFSNKRQKCTVSFFNISVAMFDLYNFFPTFL